NPGKIVGPDPSREAWPLRGVVRWRGSEVAEATATPPPERAPLLIWKDSTPDAEVARCSGCGDCRTATAPRRMCPVFRATGEEARTPRAKGTLLRVLAEPLEATPDEVKAVATLCVNCKMCRDECDARVNIPKLMLETKAAHQAENGLDRSDWFLARAEGFAAFGSNFAPIVNGLLARRPVRWVLEKLFGLPRRRRLPAFALRNFFRRARGVGLTRKGIGNQESFSRDAPRSAKVAYFVDVFAGYNDPLIGMATV